jgi:hypothetical protein
MKPRNIFVFVILLALLAFLFLSTKAAAQEQNPMAEGPTMSSAHYSLDWTASGGISGGGSSSAHYGMNQVTVSQMAANTVSASQNFSPCTGWECGVPVYGMYMPVVIR